MLGLGVVMARRRRVALAALLALVSAVAVLQLHLSAQADAAAGCDYRWGQSEKRARAVTGSGERVVVIGDSWSVGYGIDRPTGSWPSRLPARVTVAGFSGSGFSRTASPCPRSDFAERARAALADGADLVVVQGGLNDFDQSDRAVTAGFGALVKRLAAYAPDRVVIVGPAPAPSRLAGARRIDALLARLSARAGIRYVSAVGVRLPYLRDRLHLTEDGHRQFGDWVADRIMPGA